MTLFTSNSSSFHYYLLCLLFFLFTQWKEQAKIHRLKIGDLLSIFVCAVNWFNWLKTWQLPFYRMAKCVCVVLWWERSNTAKQTVKHNLRILHPPKRMKKKKRAFILLPVHWFHVYSINFHTNIFVFLFDFIERYKMMYVYCDPKTRRIWKQLDNETIIKDRNRTYLWTWTGHNICIIFVQMYSFWISHSK